MSGPCGRYRSLTFSETRKEVGIGPSKWIHNGLHGIYGVAAKCGNVYSITRARQSAAKTVKMYGPVAAPLHTGFNR